MQTKIDKKTLPQCEGCKIREKAELCDFASVVHNLKPAMFTPRGFMFEQVLVQPKLPEQIIQMPFLLWSQRRRRSLGGISVLPLLSFTKLFLCSPPAFLTSEEILLLL